ncbi:unnamed protein product, partial [Nesidiocoris tenuis]
RSNCGPINRLPFRICPYQCQKVGGCRQTYSVRPRRLQAVLRKNISLANTRCERRTRRIRI